MSRELDCPELEIRHTARSATNLFFHPTIATSIDVLEIQSRKRVQSLVDPNVTYKTDLGHEELIEHLNGPQANPRRRDGAGEQKPLLRILFVNAHCDIPPTDERFDWHDVHPMISPLTAEYLIHEMGVSSAFLAVLTTKTWVTKTGNCQWQRHTLNEGDYYGAATYILNNCAINGIQNSIVRCIDEGSGDRLLRPLAVDAFVTEATSEIWGNEILQPRMTLVEYERLDGMKVADTTKSIRELHVLSYNFLVIKEDLIDLSERIEYLLQLLTTLSKFLPRVQNAGIPVSHSLSFLLSQTGIRRRWIQNYADRTGIQINLVYNLSSQKDNYTNLKIANFTSKIATETQKDSSSMITMAAVTMLFLPGTFVSAVFSMVFFDTRASDSGSSKIALSVADGWWIYPVITIPLTILVFVTWNAWRMRRNKLQLQELQQQEVKQPPLVPPAPSYQWQAPLNRPPHNNPRAPSKSYIDSDLILESPLATSQGQSQHRLGDSTLSYHPRQTNMALMQPAITIGMLEYRQQTVKGDNSNWAPPDTEPKSRDPRHRGSSPAPSQTSQHSKYSFLRAGSTQPPLTSSELARDTGQNQDRNDFMGRSECPQPHESPPSPVLANNFTGRGQALRTGRGQALPPPLPPRYRNSPASTRPGPTNTIPKAPSESRSSEPVPNLIQPSSTRLPRLDLRNLDLLPLGNSRVGLTEYCPGPMVQERVEVVVPRQTPQPLGSG